MQLPLLQPGVCNQQSPHTELHPSWSWAIVMIRDAMQRSIITHFRNHFYPHVLKQELVAVESS